MKQKLFATGRVVLLALLSVLMIVQASLFMVRSQGVKSRHIDANSLLMLQGDASHATYLQTVILPSFFAYKLSDGAPRGLFSGTDLMSDLYGIAGEYLKVLLSDRSEFLRLSVRDGEALWNQCIASDSFLYMRYPFDLPSTLLYNDVSRTVYVDYSEMYSGDEMNIGELFVIFDSESCHMVTRSRGGEIALFSQHKASKPLTFVTSQIRAYDNNKEFISFDFYRNSDDRRYDGIPFGDTAILPTDGFSSRQITVSSALYSYLSPGIISVGLNENESRFFEILGINPEKISKYETDDGSAVYVDSHGKAELSTVGDLVYEGSDGIELSRYLGYFSSSGSYTVSEMILVTQEILRELRETDKNLVGGDGDLILTDLYLEDGMLYLSYSYATENLPLVKSDGSPFPGAVFGFMNGALYEIRLRSLTFALTGQNVQSYPLSMVVDRIRSDGSLVGCTNIIAEPAYLWSGVFPENGEGDPNGAWSDVVALDASWILTGVTVP